MVVDHPHVPDLGWRVGAYRARQEEHIPRTCLQVWHGIDVDAVAADRAALDRDAQSPGACRSVDDLFDFDGERRVYVGLPAERGGLLRDNPTDYDHLSNSEVVLLPSRRAHVREKARHLHPGDHVGPAVHRQVGAAAGSGGGGARHVHRLGRLVDRRRRRRCSWRGC